MNSAITTSLVFIQSDTLVEITVLCFARLTPYIAGFMDCPSNDFFTAAASDYVHLFWLIFLRFSNASCFYMQTS